jgi:hypothetical protein
MVQLSYRSCRGAGGARAWSTVRKAAFSRSGWQFLISLGVATTRGETQMPLRASMHGPRRLRWMSPKRVYLTRLVVEEQLEIGDGYQFVGGNDVMVLVGCEPDDISAFVGPAGVVLFQC